MEEEMSLPEILVALILALFFLGAALSFFYNVAFVQTERMFSAFFNRPFYVHLYVAPKKLQPALQSFLRQHSPFYLRLEPRRKRYFEHRVAIFINRYEFIGRQDFVVTDEVKIRIAATFVMLTFGMRGYLMTIFNKIIVYPDVYESGATGESHKGEFSPRHRAVVFSWADFVAGHSDSDDNINLGIHEFTHVLHCHAQQCSDISARIFLDAFEQITKEAHHPKNRQALLNSGYFREYAFENAFEFLAVIIEHYFETPEEFKRQFPQLYRNVSKMLNHKH